MAVNDGSFFSNYLNNQRNDYLNNLSNIRAQQAASAGYSPDMYANEGSDNIARARSAIQGYSGFFGRPLSDAEALQGYYLFNSPNSGDWYKQDPSTWGQNTAAIQEGMAAMSQHGQNLYNSIANPSPNYYVTPDGQNTGYTVDELMAISQGTKYQGQNAESIYRDLLPQIQRGDVAGLYMSPEQNQAAISAYNEALRKENNSKFKPGKFIASLAGGLSGAALGAGALGLLGPAGAATGTGLSAGGLTAGTAGAPASGSFFGNLGSSLSSSLGSLANPAVVKGATIGGIKGALSGDGLSGILKGATIGGVTGGITDYAMGGGLNDTIFSKIIGTTPGGALGGGLQGPTQSPGSGILGLISNPSSSGGMGSLGSYAGALGDIYSTYNASKTQDKVAKQLLESQGRTEAALSPYLQTGTAANQQLSDRLSAGFNPGDLTQDPGYQFRLSEAQKAADRANVARGGFYSGAALKESQNVAQGVADQTYQDAYNRWLTQNQQLAGQSGQGLQTAGALGDVYTNQGNIGANKSVAKNNILSGALSTLVGSLDKNRRVVGRNYDGTPIYA